MQRRPEAVPGRFADRVALVTGGASGIGRAVAMRLAAEGAAVVVADQDISGAQAVAEVLPGARAVALDQADEHSVGDVADDLAQLDLLCVNAGVAVSDRPVEATDSETWTQLHAVNLRGAFLVVRAAIPLLRRSQQRAVVFTASISGLLGHPGAAAYAASKAGLVNLSRSLALELAPHGIRVNAVCPGGVRTPLLRTVAGDKVADDDQQTPLGPLAEPEDVAAAVSFLGSADARHITGAELVVDGGYSAGIRRG